ncbi:pentapeptide repeat-containing protein [Actinosynnema sp. NPDC023658]|uniref:pentapeptide repeat-containing protein n=1 Tax=Actinosynnema sp. NPDC023658 TaxID=3155465 RepID=UPI0034115BE5
MNTANESKREVRLTAQRILTTHVHPGDDADYPAATFWTDIDLDLTAAVLVDWYMKDCLLHNAMFRQATFTGYAGFNGATFAGDAGFNGATFTANTWFDGATFTGNAEFGGATFTEGAWFDETTFTEDVRFDDATFTGNAGFGGATFTSGPTFDGVTFTGNSGHEPSGNQTSEPAGD